MDTKELTKITPRELYKLIERQKFCCALTGRQLTPQTTSLDHIVPVTRGGDHCMENVWFLHEAVNRAKSTSTSEEFILLCEEVARLHRRRQAAATPLPASDGDCQLPEGPPFPLFEIE